MKALRAVLANRELHRVEATWAAASLGNWAFAILLALYAYRQGGTGAVATALVVRMLPAVAAPYAAVLADPHSRRSILLCSSRSGRPRCWAPPRLRGLMIASRPGPRSRMSKASRADARSFA